MAWEWKLVWCESVALVLSVCGEKVLCAMDSSNGLYLK
jgi:hypothetical protein